MIKETSKVYDANGCLMAVAEWETEELFDVDSDETDDWDGDWESVKVKPAEKVPKCKACRICHIKHFSNCHKCPHRDSIKNFKSYEASPCSDCGSKDIGLKNGHGKVFTLDGLHDDLYVPHDPIESEAGFSTVLDCLRGFASLSPREFNCFILVKYFSLTYPQAGIEMAKEWPGEAFGKAKVRKLLEGATEKLGEVIDAGKILRGKLMGQM